MNSRGTLIFNNICWFPVIYQWICCRRDHSLCATARRCLQESCHYLEKVNYERFNFADLRDLAFMVLMIDEENKRRNYHFLFVPNLIFFWLILIQPLFNYVITKAHQEILRNDHYEARDVTVFGSVLFNYTVFTLPIRHCMMFVTILMLE